MKGDCPYLLHVRDAIGRIERYAADGKATFDADTRTQDAILRNLEVIGEAVKNLSPGIRERNSDVPWRRIAGTRDWLIHRYFGVNLETIWNVVERDIPSFKAAVHRLIEELGCHEP